jgi:hypothetical protein
MSQRTEEFKISGDDIMAKLKKLVNEGNVRKIMVKDRKGKTIAEFPLTVGVVGVLVVPVLAAVGAIVALATDCVISVEREIEKSPKPDIKLARTKKGN